MRRGQLSQGQQLTQVGASEGLPAADTCTCPSLFHGAGDGGTAHISVGSYAARQFRMLQWHNSSFRLLSDGIDADDQ